MGYPVLEDNKLAGVITAKDIEKVPLTRSDITRAHVKAMAGDVIASRRKRAVDRSPIYGTRIFEGGGYNNPKR